MKAQSAPIAITFGAIAIALVVMLNSIGDQSRFRTDASKNRSPRPFLSPPVPRDAADLIAHWERAELTAPFSPGHSFSLWFPANFSGYDGDDGRSFSVRSPLRDSPDFKIAITDIRDAPYTLTSNDHAATYTREFLLDLRDAMSKTPDMSVNGTPVQRRVSYDPQGGGVYVIAAFFAEDALVEVSLPLLFRPLSRSADRGEIVERILDGSGPPTAVALLALFDRVLQTLRTSVVNL